MQRRRELSVLGVHLKAGTGAGDYWGWREGGARAPPVNRLHQEPGFYLTLQSWASPFPSMGPRIPLSDDKGEITGF